MTCICTGRLTLRAWRLKPAALASAVSTAWTELASSSWSLRAAAMLPERWPGPISRRAALAMCRAPLAM